MAKYNLYKGQFPCHTCKKVVTTLRLYPDTKELTWVCSDNHLTSVSLQTKKKRSSVEREG